MSRTICTRISKAISFNLPSWRGLHAYALLAGTVIAILALSFGSAQAQFVCAGSVDGSEPQDGNGATASGSGTNVACGSGADASGSGVSSNTASGFLSKAIGDDSNNTATGRSANASGNDSNNTATGVAADATGDGSSNTASGSFATASGVNSGNIAIGGDLDGSGTGANASGDGTRNTSVGADSTATGANSSAFGGMASATHSNSAAFGSGATTTRDNQQVFGTASNTYTAPGITSGASATAQVAPTRLVTSNEAGDLAAHTFSDLGLATQSDIASVNSRVSRNSDKIDENAEGVAMSLAMAGAFLPQPGETIRFSGNWGNFEGSNALAFNGAAKISGNTYFTAGFGAGLEESTYGARAGLSIGW